MAEVEAAVNKFPIWPSDPIHAVAVLGEEFGELQKAVPQCVYEPHKATKGDVRKEAIQTAAMAIRFLQSLDRYDYSPGDQHSQDEFEKPQAVAMVDHVGTSYGSGDNDTTVIVCKGADISKIKSGMRLFT